MPAGYDSWLDDYERGDGYAIGGAGIRQPVRHAPRWRIQLVHQLRLVVIDLAILLVCAGVVFLAALTRSLPLGVVAVVICTAGALWFRHQRMEHERRPR